MASGGPTVPELVVGVDSYVTLEEALNYISATHTPSEPLANAFMELSADEKIVKLRKAAQTIDHLPLVGKKAQAQQEMAFPRVLFARPCEYDGSEPVIPKEVKAAQCEQAIFSLDDANTIQSATRAQLQRQGVSSYRIGDLSESYGGAMVGSYIYSTSKCNDEVLTLMSIWMGGGYRICHYLPGT